MTFTQLPLFTHNSIYRRTKFGKLYVPVRRQNLMLPAQSDESNKYKYKHSYSTHFHFPQLPGMQIAP